MTNFNGPRITPIVFGPARFHDQFQWATNHPDRFWPRSVLDKRIMFSWVRRSGAKTIKTDLIRLGLARVYHNFHFRGPTRHETGRKRVGSLLCLAVRYVLRAKL